MTKNWMTGPHPLRLDEKDRLTIPAKLVAVMREIEGLSESEPLNVVVTVVKKRLGIFPAKVFEKMIEKLEGLPKAAMVSNMDIQSLDKMNRIRIPTMHAQLFNLVDDVVVMGFVKHLEVVNRQQWVEQTTKMLDAMPETWEFLD